MKEAAPNKTHVVEMDQQHTNTASEDEITGAEALEMPGTMDLKTVMSMFQNLKIQMSQDVAMIRADIASSNTKVEQQNQELTKAISETDENVQGLQDQLITYRATTRILMGSMEKMQMQIDELKDRLDRADLTNAKRMLVITGLYLSEKKSVGYQQLYHFFQKEMVC